jgi:hypothetical protein
MPKSRVTQNWVKAFRKAIKQTCPVGWTVINDRGRVRVQIGKRGDIHPSIFLTHGRKKIGLMLINELKWQPISI